MILNFEKESRYLSFATNAFYMCQYFQGTRFLKKLSAYVFSQIFLVQRIGCFKDTSRRAIRQLDGRLPFLRGNYQRRKQAIAKCALGAARYGYIVFGVQHGGWCASGPKAHRTFAKYGRSKRCRNGKGGPWANDVYRVSG